jgi:HEPN domain-containing protein
MAEREKQIRLFERAAQQRLAAAELLFTHDFYLDAIYLAGYTVECSLKALILRRTPRGDFEAMNEQLTEVGAKGHDLEYLKKILKKQLRGGGRSDREALGALAVHWKALITWSTDLRYEVRKVRRREAEHYLDAVRAACDICARS